MLVLTRRVDESIRIGDNIRITVVKIKGTQQICVGIDAPRDVPVLREELIDAPVLGASHKSAETTD